MGLRKRKYRRKSKKPQLTHTESERLRYHAFIKLLDELVTDINIPVPIYLKQDQLRLIWLYARFLHYSIRKHCGFPLDGYSAYENELFECKDSIPVSLSPLKKKKRKEVKKQNSETKKIDASSIKETKQVMGMQKPLKPKPTSIEVLKRNKINGWKRKRIESLEQESSSKRKGAPFIIVLKNADNMINNKTEKSVLVDSRNNEERDVQNKSKIAEAHKKILNSASEVKNKINETKSTETQIGKTDLVSLELQKKEKSNETVYFRNGFKDNNKINSIVSQNNKECDAQNKLNVFEVLKEILNSVSMVKNNIDTTKPTETHIEKSDLVSSQSQRKEHTETVHSQNGFKDKNKLNSNDSRNNEGHGVQNKLNISEHNKENSASKVKNSIDETKSTEAQIVINRFFGNSFMEEIEIIYSLPEFAANQEVKYNMDDVENNLISKVEDEINKDNSDIINLAFNFITSNKDILWNIPVYTNSHNLEPIPLSSIINSNFENEIINDYMWLIKDLETDSNNVEEADNSSWIQSSESDNSSICSLNTCRLYCDHNFLDISDSSNSFLDYVIDNEDATSICKFPFNDDFYVNNIFQTNDVHYLANNIVNEELYIDQLCDNNKTSDYELYCKLSSSDFDDSLFKFGAAVPSITDVSYISSEIIEPICNVNSFDDIHNILLTSTINSEQNSCFELQNLTSLMDNDLYNLILSELDNKEEEISNLLGNIPTEVTDNEEANNDLIDNPTISGDLHSASATNFQTDFSFILLNRREQQISPIKTRKRKQATTETQNLKTKIPKQRKISNQCTKKRPIFTNVDNVSTNIKKAHFSEKEILSPTKLELCVEGKESVNKRKKNSLEQNEKKSIDYENIKPNKLSSNNNFSPIKTRSQVNLETAPSNSKKKSLKGKIQKNNNNKLKPKNKILHLSPINSHNKEHSFQISSSHIPKTENIATEQNIKQCTENYQKTFVKGNLIHRKSSLKQKKDFMKKLGLVCCVRNVGRCNNLAKNLNPTGRTSSRTRKPLSNLTNTKEI